MSVKVLLNKTPSPRRGRGLGEGGFFNKYIFRKVLTTTLTLTLSLSGRGYK